MIPMELLARCVAITLPRLYDTPPLAAFNKFISVRLRECGDCEADGVSYLLRKRKEPVEPACFG